MIPVPVPVIHDGGVLTVAGWPGDPVHMIAKTFFLT
jgi:hypothetical protein